MPENLEVDEKVTTFAHVNETSRDGAEVARWAHNPKVVGSNPAPATKRGSPFGGPLIFYMLGIGMRPGSSVVAYLRHAVAGGMPSPGTLCCARVPGYGRVSSLRDDGQCAWSVAHLRSAWLWGRPASPCAIRWARRANEVMGEWRAAGASQPSAVLAMVWMMAGASEMRYSR